MSDTIDEEGRDGPDATLFGRSNSCSFMHLGKKLTIHPTQSKDTVKRGSSHVKERGAKVNFITVKEVEKELTEGAPVWILTTRETQEPTPREHTQEVKEFCMSLVIFSLTTYLTNYHP